jgi:hypothetical protein
MLIWSNIPMRCQNFRQISSKLVFSFSFDASMAFYCPILTIFFIFSRKPTALSVESYFVGKLNSSYNLFFSNGIPMCLMGNLIVHIQDCGSILVVGATLCMLIVPQIPEIPLPWSPLWVVASAFLCFCSCTVYHNHLHIPVFYYPRLNSFFRCTLWARFPQRTICSNSEKLERTFAPHHFVEIYQNF